MFLTRHEISDPCAPTRRTVYSLNFILSAVGALTTYFNTALLLERGVSELYVGLTYSLAAVATIVLLVAAPNIFSRLGNYRSLGVLGFASAAALLALAFTQDAGSTVALFVLWSAVVTLVYLLLDMILEGSMQSENTTGGSRGLFVSVANAAWFVFPVAGGVLAAFGSFSLLFSVASLISFVGLGIALYLLKDIRNHTYTPIRIQRAFSFLAFNKDLRLVFIAQFLLRIFFALMTIYTPIYLLQRQGVSLEAFGSIISIAMIAYLIFEWPAGKLADNFWGEKELMAVGFLILAGTTATLSFVSGPIILVFGALLFCTRIGAALVDVTTESYFFKQVSGADADIVSMFRILGPLSYIAGPILASLLLLFVPVSYVFVMCGTLMLLGIPIALSLRDTR